MARVLLVDDDPDVLDGLGAWLRYEHEVLLASGFPEALEALFAGPPPDVIICDYEMPPFCGDDLLAVVASRFPATYRILYTGMPRGLLDGAGAAAHRVISKGTDPNELSELIREHAPR